MIDERFNIVSLGMNGNNTSHKQAIHQLMKSFKIDKRQAAQLLKTQKKVIKKDVNWSTASTYLKKLSRAGVAAEFDIALNRELFFNSLTQKKRQQTQKHNHNHIFQLDTSRISPLFFSLPASSSIKMDNQKTAFYINSVKANLSSLMCLVLSIVLIIATQYGISLLAPATITNSTPVAIGTLFVPIAIALLPFLFNIRRHLHLATGKNHSRSGLTCKEQRCFNPFRKKYTFYSRQGDSIAHITQSLLEPKKLFCYTPDGKLMLQLLPSNYSQATLRHSIKRLVKQPSLSNVQRVVSIACNTAIRKQPSNDPHERILNGQLKPDMIISDAHNTTVANLFKQDNAYVEMTNQQKESPPLPCVLMLAILGLSCGS